MKMATNYNYGSAVSDIIKYKKWWQDADAAGDETAKNNHANSAASAYEWLRNNGYGDAANTLQASNYTDAKKWATNGKQQTRPYSYSVGQKYGLSNSDVDKIITYDNGNVFIGGKNIGSPDLVVDGVSYWDDTSTLDKELSDYISRSGTTVKTGVDNPAYNQSMQSATDKNNVYAGYIDSDRKDVQGKYNDIFNYANQDITKTDEYKSTYNSIMGKYDLSALQGRDNAAASGAASNGGNIDSYAAANAMRQQAALTATGQQVAHQAGLDAYNARVSNVSNILNNLGVYNSSTYDAMNQTIANDAGIGQQYFENAETAKNNETARLVEQANVTGYTPKQWQYSNNPYFNSDGTLNSVYTSDEFDNTGGFTTIINNARAKLATTTDATERANLQATINYATQAKAYKTLNNAQYAQYAHEVSGVTPQQTETRRQFDKTMDYNNKALETGSADTRYGIDADVSMNANTNATQERMNTANNQNNLDQIETTALYSQAATGQITDAQMEKVAEDINESYKDVLGENIIVKVGNKYVAKNNYGGAIARYMMSQYFKDAYQTAAWMQAMFGTPPEDTAVAVGLTQGNKPHDWEKAYNPADYNLN